MRVEAKLDPLISSHPLSISSSSAGSFWQARIVGCVRFWVVCCFPSLARPSSRSCPVPFLQGSDTSPPLHLTSNRGGRKCSRHLPVGPHPAAICSVVIEQEQGRCHLRNRKPRHNPLLTTSATARSTHHYPPPLALALAQPAFTWPGTRAACSRGGTGIEGRDRSSLAPSACYSTTDNPTLCPARPVAQLNSHHARRPEDLGYYQED